MENRLELHKIDQVDLYHYDGYWHGQRCQMIIKFFNGQYDSMTIRGYNPPFDRKPIERFAAAEIERISEVRYGA